jgi:hypothetical protein
MLPRSYLIAGVVTLAGVCLGLVTLAASPEEAAPPVSNAGRYQAVATGGEIYLVDTATGETWVPNHVFGLNDWMPHIQPLPNAVKR